MGAAMVTAPDREHTHRSALRVGELGDGRAELLYFRPVGDAGRIAAQFRGQRRQGGAPLWSGSLLGARERRARGGDPCRGEAVRPLELVEIGARQREARRPREFRLPLGIEIIEMYRLGRIDFVL